METDDAITIMFHPINRPLLNVQLQRVRNHTSTSTTENVEKCFKIKFVWKCVPEWYRFVGKRNNQTAFHSRKKFIDLLSTNAIQQSNTNERTYLTQNILKVWGDQVECVCVTFSKILLNEVVRGVIYRKYFAHFAMLKDSIYSQLTVELALAMEIRCHLGLSNESCLHLLCQFWFVSFHRFSGSPQIAQRE